MMLMCLIAVRSDTMSCIGCVDERGVFLFEVIPIFLKSVSLLKDMHVYVCFLSTDILVSRQNASTS